MIKSICYVVAMACCLGMFYFVMGRALTQPIVVKDINGNVCGCVTNGDRPTKEQCLNVKNVYHTIVIQKCVCAEIF